MSKYDEVSNLAINFDLDTKKTKEVFGSRGTSPACAMIKDFLEAHGFEHRQYSGYRTSRPISQMAALEIVSDMYKKFPWLRDCVQRMDLIRIDRLYDLHKIILSESSEAPMSEDKEHEQIPSLASRANQAKGISQELNLQNQLRQNKQDISR